MGRFTEMPKTQIASMVMLGLAAILASVSLIFPTVSWSIISTNAAYGEFCFEESIGLLFSQQCTCDTANLKCWEVNVFNLPAEYDFLKTGGRVVFGIMVTAIFSCLGSIGVAFARGGYAANRRNGKSPKHYKNMRLFSSISAGYSAFLFFVASMVWVFYINIKLNANFSQYTKGSYKPYAGLYMCAASFVLAFGACGIELKRDPEKYADYE